MGVEYFFKNWVCTLVNCGNIEVLYPHWKTEFEDHMNKVSEHLGFMWDGKELSGKNDVT